RIIGQMNSVSSAIEKQGWEETNTTRGRCTHVTMICVHLLRWSVLLLTTFIIS
ncbi:hypothetical protein L9F63_003296, partial [Diploptera punctata]